MNPTQSPTELKNLTNLLTEEINELYDAERQLLKVFPKMCAASSSEELADALAEHFEETRTHVDRLDEVGMTLGFTPGGRRCRAMEGLVAEIEEFLTAKGNGLVRDLAIIAAAQRVELYELSAYGSAKALAGRLGLDQVVDVLAGTADEEAGADRNLTRIAEKLYPRAEVPVAG